MIKVTAQAEMSGGWWAITIPDIDGGIHTQARRLDQVAAMAADAVALVMEVDKSTVGVEVEVVLDRDAREVIDRAREASAQAVEAQAHASARMREAASLLRREGHLTTRDAAELLGVSSQRVSQLVPV